MPKLFVLGNLITAVSNNLRADMCRADMCCPLDLARECASSLPAPDDVHSKVSMNSLRQPYQSPNPETDSNPFRAEPGRAHHNST